jgi:hypothetical protein
LGHVRVDRRAGRADLLPDFDGARQEGAERFGHLLDERLQLTWPAFLFRLPAEGQDLLDEIRGPSHPLNDFLQVLPVLAVLRQILQGELRVAEDGLEDVVEVVAMPPARVPIASSFWARRSLSSTCLRSVASRT